MPTWLSVVTVVGPVLVALAAALAIFTVIGRIAGQIPELEP
jgi:hypothetical protein